MAELSAASKQIDPRITRAKALHDEANAILIADVRRHPNRRQSKRGQRAALAKLDEAVAVAPQYMFAYIRRMQLRLTLGDIDGAHQDVLAALRIGSQDSVPYSRLAQYYSGKYARALFKEAMVRERREKLYDFECMSRGWIAETYFVEGNFKECERQIRRNITHVIRNQHRLRFIRPSREYEMLGRALEALGKFDQAADAYRRAIPSNKGDASQAAVHAVLAHVHRGAMADALKVLNELKAHRTPCDELYSYAVRALAGQKVEVPKKLFSLIGSAECCRPNDFYVAVTYAAARKFAVARRCLRIFLNDYDVPQRGHRFTFAWEIAKAKELLKQRGAIIP